MRNDSEEILFQSFLREALVSSPGMGRFVHVNKKILQKSSEAVSMDSQKKRPGRFGPVDKARMETVQ